MTNTRDAADVIHHSTKHGTPALRPLVNFPRLDPTTDRRGSSSIETFRYLLCLASFSHRLRRQ